jgi:hypothetical protein
MNGGTRALRGHGLEQATLYRLLRQHAVSFVAHTAAGTLATLIDAPECSARGPLIGRRACS